MNHVYYSLIALFAITACTSQPKTKTVELPPATFANTRSLEFAKVTLTDTVTVIDVEAFYTPGYWIKIVSDSYLQADGKKYMIRSGEGIDLDSLFWMPKSGEASFKLVFEPMPINTKTFDFIESDCEACFKIWGINLSNKRASLPKLSREFTKNHKEETDLNLGWEKGDATVSGEIWGYVPNTLEWTVIYSNPITGKNNNIPLEIDDKGTFKANVPIYSPSNLFIVSNAAYIPIKVAPGKESSVIINLPEIYREGSRLWEDQESFGKKYYYGGYLARLNNDLANEGIMQSVQKDHFDTIADMDVNEYKDFLTDKYQESVDHNDTLDISPLAKKVLRAINAFALSENILFADSYLIQVFGRNNQLSQEDAYQQYKSVQKAKNFSDYYQLIPYNDPEMLLVPYIENNISNMKYARGQTNDPLEATQTGVNYLSQIWNTDKALLLDLINSQQISSFIQDFTPLTDEQKQALTDYFPEVISQVLKEENEILLAKIEENKNKTGYTVHNTPTIANEELFVEMLKPFKGKVILVDVWATWCGPCRMANKEIEPLKAQLADKEDLVFLYLAGEDSPENTWKNMIVDLKGEHYRVNQGQWDYLRESLKARGVPTYIIIDKEGNHSFHSVGFPGVDSMKRELMKALKKKG